MCSQWLFPLALSRRRKCPEFSDRERAPACRWSRLWWAVGLGASFKDGGRKDALFVGLLLGGRACVLTVGVSSVCAGLGSSGGVLESGG